MTAVFSIHDDFLALAQRLSLEPSSDEDKRRKMLREVARKYCGGSDYMQLERIRALLKTGTKSLEMVKSADSFWGVGLDGQGENHLGRILMAVRSVVLGCDYYRMQNLTVDDAGEADDLRDEDDPAGLASRVCVEAWKQLNNPEWNPIYVAPGLRIEILRGPMYGQGIKELREILRPWLGVALSSCCLTRYFDEPRLLLRAKEISNAHIEIHHGLIISRQLTLRLGVQRLETVREVSLPENWEVSEEADDRWRDALRANERLAQDPTMPQFSRDWSLEAVYVIPTDNCDDLDKFQYYQPAALGLLLELRGRSASGDLLPSSEVLPQYVMLFAAQDEGFYPSTLISQQAPTEWLGTPYGKPFELLLCSPALGALPKIEAAFVAEYAHWGMELPPALVVSRSACASMDDGWDGLTRWDISIAFGRDEQGEYLDVDSYHRMTGEGYHRIYENGESTKRDAPISAHLLKTDSIEKLDSSVDLEAVVSDENIQVAPNSNAASPKWFVRSLGVVVALIGLYLLTFMVGHEPRPGQMIFFATVCLIVGVWVAYRPDDFETGYKPAKPQKTTSNLKAIPVKPTIGRLSDEPAYMHELLKRWPNASEFHGALVGRRLIQVCSVAGNATNRQSEGISSEFWLIFAGDDAASLVCVHPQWIVDFFTKTWVMLPRAVHVPSVDRFQSTQNEIFSPHTNGESLVGLVLKNVTSRNMYDSHEVQALTFELCKPADLHGGSVESSKFATLSFKESEDWEDTSNDVLSVSDPHYLGSFYLRRDVRSHLLDNWDTLTNWNHPHEKWPKAWQNSAHFSALGDLTSSLNLFLTWPYSMHAVQAPAEFVQTLNALVVFQIALVHRLQWVVTDNLWLDRDGEDFGPAWVSIDSAYDLGLLADAASETCLSMEHAFSNFKWCKPKDASFQESLANLKIKYSDWKKHFYECKHNHV